MINSIEALSEDSSPVIKLHAFHEENSNVVIQVWDNGRGIHEDKLNEIFTPFYSTKKDGTGIGLSFARQIILLHKGNISVKSIPGKETIFTLRF
jgi:signal transduction histidine kinase